MKINTITKLAVVLGLSGVTSAFAISSFELVQVSGGAEVIGSNLVGVYGAKLDGAAPFNTFCVELDTPINWGQYSPGYTIDPQVLNAVGGNQAISGGTAYLFNTYANQNLTAHQFAEVQLAIWQLQGYSLSSHFASLTGYNLGSGSYFEEGFLNSNYSDSSVMAINVWNGASYEARNDVQSFLINVPDGASTLGLIGLGMMALALFRRRN